MADPSHINLLVIPDLFPKYEGDVQGIFVPDYIAAVQPACHVNVLVVRLTGAKKGLNVETKDGATIYRYNLSDKKIPFYLKPFYYILWFRRGYRAGLQLTKPDLIHAHGTILSGTLSARLAKRWQVPFLITEHQGPFSMISGSFWKRNWARRILQKADAVLTVSEHLKQEILDTNIHPRYIEVTNNPVDTERFTLKTPGEKHNMLFVGRLDNFKGALRCVQAFERLAESSPAWRFTVVGDGEDRQPIEAFLQQHAHLRDCVVLKGTMQKQEIAQQMREADFLVFPSRHESFGLVVAEALSCGLPVIVGDRTAPKEFVDATNGLLLPPDDLDAIARAMQQMMEDHASYDSQAIRRNMIEKFSFENFGKKLVAIYRRHMKKG